MNRRALELSSGSTLAHQPTDWNASFAKAAIVHQGLYGARLDSDSAAIVRANAIKEAPLVPLLEIVRGRL